MPDALRGNGPSDVNAQEDPPQRKDDPADEEGFYQMYVADLVFDGGQVTGIENVLRLSPEGSSNTCGWFHPTEKGVVVFGSTVVPPTNPDKTGYQRESSRYRWQFPQEMDIVRCELAKLAVGSPPRSSTTWARPTRGSAMWTRRNSTTPAS